MDIGFYLVDCDNSEKHNSIINLINQLVVDHPYDNIILFNNKYRRVDSAKKFPILHLSHAKYFYGTLVCFDMKSASMAKTFPGPSKQFFYCDTLDWTSHKEARAVLWNNIYKNMNIISTDKKIADLLNICWELNIHTLPDLNAGDFYNVISKV